MKREKLMKRLRRGKLGAIIVREFALLPVRLFDLNTRTG
jgi:hypothetical protein